MGTGSTFVKDPNEVLDYTWDWGTNYLADGETISTSTVTVEAGITKDSDTNDTTSATVWLSGGTESQNYTVTNQIVTSDARTAERSILVQVRER